MVEITESQACLARYFIAEAIRRRRLTGQPLALTPVGELLTALSATPPETASGHETVSGAGESEPDDLIGINEAAAILGCTTRHCRRLAHDLDGIRVGARSWAFHRDTVTTYAEGKHHAN